METITLNNGVEMPLAGYGVFQQDSSTTETAVVAAINAGYRLIDTAAAYGNEVAVGRAIAKSGVARNQLFITTKLWLDATGYEATKAAFNKSLTALGLDYVDLYLIHQPFGDVYGSWRAMEELYHAGKIRAIGVSNFNSVQLLDLALFNQVKPAVNQIEINPWEQQAQERAEIVSAGIQPEAWAPFAEGKDGIFTNPVLTQLANNHHKSVGQVVLRWLTQQGIVALARTTKPTRMLENLDIFDFMLTDTEMVEITKLDKNQPLFMDYNDPKTLQFLAKSVGKQLK